MENADDFNDTLGAGSYPEPPEKKEKHFYGKVVLTFNIDADIPRHWNIDDIEDDLKRNLKDYVGLYDYEDIDIDIYGVKGLD